MVAQVMGRKHINTSEWGEWSRGGRQPCLGLPAVNLPPRGSGLPFRPLSGLPIGPGRAVNPSDGWNTEVRGYKSSCGRGLGPRLLREEAQARSTGSPRELLFRVWGSEDHQGRGAHGRHGQPLPAHQGPRVHSLGAVKCPLRTLVPGPSQAPVQLPSAACPGQALSPAPGPSPQPPFSSPLHPPVPHPQPQPQGSARM